MSDLIKPYLTYMVENEASDLYLTTGAPPSVKIFGQLQHLNAESLTRGRVQKIANEILTEQQQIAFEQYPELNLALQVTHVGRFRVNIFRQRNETAMVVRHIKSAIPGLADLGIPKSIRPLVMEKAGLVLIVGGTNTGKSTTLASLIDYRNTHSAGHIITIEDPIEYLHQHKKSIVNQREVGIDTDSYADALKNTLRQAPDVILVGEINDPKTMQHGIAFSETGHLCLATLHATNAHQALERIVNFFPQAQRDRIYLDLSLNLKAIICQRLIPSIDGKRVAAFEILLNSALVKETLQKGDIDTIGDIMQKSEDRGMLTFDSSLYKLYKAGKIDQEQAFKHANSHNNLRLRIGLEEKVFNNTETSPKPNNKPQKSNPFLKGDLDQI